MKYLLAISAILFTATCFAQQKQYVFFFNKSNERVFNKDSADYLRIIKGPLADSKLYNATEYYISGKLKMVGQSSGIDPVIWEGACVTYWPSGNKKISACYKKSKLSGSDSSFFNNGKLHDIVDYNQSDSTLTDPNSQWLSIFIKTCNDSTGKALVVDGNGYYKDYSDSGEVTEQGAVKDGKRIGEWQGGYAKDGLTFKEMYDNAGALISGTSTDADGTHFYKNRYVSAHFKGGINEFYKYLSHTIRYPAIARENNTQGKVILSFIINKSGELEDIKVLQTVSDEIDAEAIRVLKASPDWEPGRSRGRLVRQLYFVPLRFSLSRR